MARRFYKDWAKDNQLFSVMVGQLNGDAFEDQMFYLVPKGTAALHMTDEGTDAQSTLERKMTWTLMQTTLVSLSKFLT